MNTRPITIVIACLAAATLLSAAGCATSGPVRVQNYPPRPVADVDAVVLRLTPPAPVNWDERPGADGLQVQMNFFQIDEDLSVTVKGSLELSLYEGNLRPEDIARTQPLRTWKFSSVQLASHCGKSAFGWGYAMRLPWGMQPPSATRTTLTARYVSPDGHVTSSKPLCVPMGAE